ncbi:MAG: peptide chain release factor N(5)-glutamine methyltransferase [Lachnospiraceae bacterium]|nr:peptide chain release factor N(5)-glutamine methyltransferase [Lachnospiraceae bacterium]
MTIEALLQDGIQKLRQAEVMDAELDAMYLLEDIFHIKRVDFLLNRQMEVTTKQQEAYMHNIDIRATHVPLQHILGTQEFMGLDFFVNEHVLIPRQDTEVLVEETMKYAKGKRVLDVCTGSGCIILSLCKLCDLKEAVGVDLSTEALKVANQNKENLGCDVTFVESDLFSNVEGTFDVIVSNPPYIASDVIEGLMPEVKEHEPRMALDGGMTGLDFYEKIIEQSGNYLADQGHLLFEIGYDQGKAVKEMMEQSGFKDCRVLKDLAGLDRVVAGVWNK